MTVIIIKWVKKEREKGWKLLEKNFTYECDVWKIFEGVVRGSKLLTPWIYLNKFSGFINAFSGNFKDFWDDFNDFFDIFIKKIRPFFYPLVLIYSHFLSSHTYKDFFLLFLQISPLSTLLSSLPTFSPPPCSVVVVNCHLPCRNFRSHPREFFSFLFSSIAKKCLKFNPPHPPSSH